MAMFAQRGGSFRVPVHGGLQLPLDDTLRSAQPHVNIRLVSANVWGAVAMGQDAFPNMLAGSMVAAPAGQQPLPPQSAKPDNWVSIFTRPDGIGVSSASGHARGERKVDSHLRTPCPSARHEYPRQGAAPRSRLEEGLSIGAGAAAAAAPSAVAAGRFGGWAKEGHEVLGGSTPEQLWPSYHDDDAASAGTGSDRTLEPDEYCASLTPSPRRQAAGASHAFHDASPLGAATEAEPSLAFQYRCPGCSFVSSSMNEALSHCETSQSQPVLCQVDNSVLRPALTEIVSVIAFNDVGEPSLLIRRDPTTGKQRTVARNDDGTESVFGDDTVRSMVENTEDTMASWLESLNVTELKGLLNEINHHVAEGSRLYHQTKTEVEQLNRETSYSFFGLAEDAAEKELDNAYRQLAKKMHPDKNDGTDEAKVKFQQMKDHYEALKRQRAEVQGKGKENCENRSSSDDDIKADCTDLKAEEQKSNVDSRPKQAGLAELLKEKDRGPLDEAARQYLTVLKNIKSNMSILQREQQKLVSETSHPALRTPRPAGTA